MIRGLYRVNVTLSCNPLLYLSPTGRIFLRTEAIQVFALIDVDACCSNVRLRILLPTCTRDIKNSRPVQWDTNAALGDRSTICKRH